MKEQVMNEPARCACSVGAAYLDEKCILCHRLGRLPRGLGATTAFAPTNVSFHFRRDERGQPCVAVIGFMGMGTEYRWGNLTSAGWAELPRNVVAVTPKPTAFFAFERMDQRRDEAEYYAPISAPEIVADGPQHAPLIDPVTRQMWSENACVREKPLTFKDLTEGASDDD